ncbi:hypothetical protein B0H14DRAFT_2621770 [Mycena olivaceomarginata]|nr:hypothetical protein B0H14DRAFT_2621770 [Mycena olivaceomarginata]
MQTQTPLMHQNQDLFCLLNDHHLKACFITELFNFSDYYPISNPEALASQALEHLKHFDDPDLECVLCRLHLNMAIYYHEVKIDLVEAENLCKKSISLAISTGNSKRQSHGFCLLAWINAWLGKYSMGQMCAHEARKSARVSGDLYGEAVAIHAEALCWQELGHYRKSLSLGIMVWSLLGLCGMSSSEANLGIMATQAEVHMYKSEYSEARKICTEIAQISADQNPHWHAFALLNVAEVKSLIGVPKHEMLQLNLSVLNVWAMPASGCRLFNVAVENNIPGTIP